MGAGLGELTAPLLRPFMLAACRERRQLEHWKGSALGAAKRDAQDRVLSAEVERKHRCPEYPRGEGERNTSERASGLRDIEDSYHYILSDR